MRISSNYSAYCSPQNRKRQDSTSFGGLTNNRVFNKIETSVAEGCGWLVGTDTAKKLVTATNKQKWLSEKLTSHLIVLGSTLLSGFYIAKTLKNKDMEESKRKTLAINQGLVYGLSTVMAYVFDGKARKYFNKNIIAKFVEINKKGQREKFAKILSENPNWDKATRTREALKSHRAFVKNLNKWKDGFALARTIIIVDTVYRFIAPVIVTPFANKLGNNLKEKNRL